MSSAGSELSGLCTQGIPVPLTTTHVWDQGNKCPQQGQSSPRAALGALGVQTGHPCALSPHTGVGPVSPECPQRGQSSQGCTARAPLCPSPPHRCGTRGVSVPSRVRAPPALPWGSQGADRTPLCPTAAPQSPGSSRASSSCPQQVWGQLLARPQGFFVHKPGPGAGGHKAVDSGSPRAGGGAQALWGCREHQGRAALAPPSPKAALRALGHQHCSHHCLLPKAALKAPLGWCPGWAQQAQGRGDPRGAPTDLLHPWDMLPDPAKAQSFLKFCCLGLFKLEK